QVAGGALEPPLPGLAAERLGQGDGAGVAGGQVLGDPLDRPVLAGPVAALEDDDGLLALVHRPLLVFDQVDLQRDELGLVAAVAFGHSGPPGHTSVAVQKFAMTLWRAPSEFL